MELSNVLEENHAKTLTLQQLKLFKKEISQQDILSPENNKNFTNNLVNHENTNKLYSNKSTTLQSKRYRRPIEVSSKKPKSIQDAYGEIKKESMRKKARDPRFSNLSGTLNDNFAAKSYEFINNLRNKEKSILKLITTQGKKPLFFNLNDFNISDIPLHDCKYTKASQQEKDEAAKLLLKMESQETLRKNKTKLAKLKQEIQQKEKIEIAKGIKNPFFTKHSKIKKKMIDIKSKRKQDLFYKRKEQKLSARDKQYDRIPKRKAN